MESYRNLNVMLFYLLMSFHCKELATGIDIINESVSIVFDYFVQKFIMKYQSNVQLHM